MIGLGRWGMRTTTMHASFCLFGAAPDTPNLGVTALHDSLVAGLRTRLPDCELTVFDFGRNPRPNASDEGRALRRLGAQPTRRIWRPESVFNMRLANRLGGAWSAGARRLRRSAAVLDMSAGDSFSDIYGSRRFEAIVAPKRMAVDARVPLVLLPQTYGPFEHPKNRTEAARLVRASAVAWARDPRSFEQLRGLLGDEYDPQRHRQGVDVAFGLPAVRPTEPLSPLADEWLQDGRGPVVGLNVSGLIYLDPARASRDFAVRANYGAQLEVLVRGLLARDGVRVVLIPHALSPPGHPESDREACDSLAASLGDVATDRLTVLEGTYGPSQVKELIGRLDWFCGTRMHSTIAALSSGTPAAALSYSPKFRGVFESCGIGERVIDLAAVDAEEGPARLIEAFDARDSDRVRLEAAMPGVSAMVEAQLDSVAAFALEGASADASPR